MKKSLFVFIAFFWAISLQANEIQPLLDSNSTENNQLVNEEFELTNLNFSFENNIDSLTLELFETGNITVKWTNIQPVRAFIGIRYRIIGQNKWNEIITSNKNNSIVLNDLEENHILEYNIGGGTKKNNIQYDTRIHHFNTLSRSIFKVNTNKDKEEGAEIYWAIEPNKLADLLTIYPNANYILKYNTNIGKKQNADNPAKSPWVVIDSVDINKVKYKLEELVGGEKYVYKVGLRLDDQIVWSKDGKFEAERTWGIFKLLVLIGSLGMFIFGMKIMSEGLQKAAGSSLRNMLGSITSNRISGVLTGFGITSVVQSSSVTTVMTVSFVNAGLLTLRQSAGVMMGANIGTTLTAWLILFFGFKVSLSAYAFVFIAFGAPLLFLSKGKAKAWASVIIGFSLLFMGLDSLKDSVPTLGTDSSIVQFFVDFKDAWYGPVMFVILGAFVTVVIQSSSAAMALTMTLVAGNVIPFEVASAMILGENIGTTITAEIASLIGNVHAKRSARIHSLFNIIGVIWALVFFAYILKGIAYFMEGDPFTDGNYANTGLAMFHTAFNLLNVLVLLPFVPWLVRVAEKTVKSKGVADEEFHLDYIGGGIMSTPDISILEAKKEIAKFGEITSRMSKFTQTLLIEQNKKKKSKLHDKLHKYEEITDRVEIEVATYLAKVSEGEMSEKTAQHVRSMNSIVNDLERIGDIFYQMSKTLERKEELKVWFMPEQRESLFEMFGLVDKAFIQMIENLNSDWDGVSLESANLIETRINKKRDEMRTEHIANMANSTINMESSMVFSNLFSSCEKVGDHIINVTEAIKGKI